MKQLSRRGYSLEFSRTVGFQVRNCLKHKRSVVVVVPAVSPILGSANTSCRKVAAVSPLKITCYEAR